MADKITKEAVKKVSTPQKTDAVKEIPKKIEMDEVANPVSSPSQLEAQKLKDELRKEILGEMGAEEVFFMKTTLAGTADQAKRLNESEKIVVMWELEEGEKTGALEEVTINGAVAQIPKGVAVLVPKQAATLIKGYQKAEKTAGENIRNLKGGLGLKADRDDEAKAALGV